MNRNVPNGVVLLQFLKPAMQVGNTGSSQDNSPNEGCPALIFGKVDDPIRNKNAVFLYV